MAVRNQTLCLEFDWWLAQAWLNRVLWGNQRPRLPKEATRQMRFTVLCVKL